MLTAEQSPKVAEEDDDHGAVGPEVTEAVGAAVGADEFDSSEAAQVHDWPP
jgi:hypothetical protein